MDLKKPIWIQLRAHPLGVWGCEAASTIPTQYIKTGAKNDDHNPNEMQIPALNGPNSPVKIPAGSHRNFNDLAHKMGVGEGLHTY